MTAVMEGQTAEKNTDYLDKACLYYDHDPVGQFHDSQLCNQVNGFHDRSDDREVSKQTR